MVVSNRSNLHFQWGENVLRFPTFSKVTVALGPNPALATDETGKGFEAPGKSELLKVGTKPCQQVDLKLKKILCCPLFFPSPPKKKKQGEVLFSNVEGGLRLVAKSLQFHVLWLQSMCRKTDSNNNRQQQHLKIESLYPRKVSVFSHVSPKKDTEDISSFHQNSPKTNPKLFQQSESCLNCLLILGGFGTLQQGYQRWTQTRQSYDL